MPVLTFKMFSGTGAPAT